MRKIIPGILAMTLIVVASNILVQYILFDGWLTWGALTYPLAFLTTDVMNKVYGPSAARKVIFVGFVTGIVCSLIGTQIVNDFGPLVTLRIAIASGLGFLTAQTIDLAIFEKFRQSVWWKAPLISSVIGSFVDTAIFFTVAFSLHLSLIEQLNDVSWANELRALFGFGPQLPYWIGLGLADYGVKLGLALLALIPFNLLVKQVNLAKKRV
jgi:uncharacterized integral membrane protein (TIGR00697 family)